MVSRRTSFLALCILICALSSSALEASPDAESGVTVSEKALRATPGIASAEAKGEHGADGKEKARAVVVVENNSVEKKVGAASETSKKEGAGEKEEEEKRLKLALSEGFPEAFFASLSMILVSELGDKTFFIAAIMAMTFDKGVVYAGAMGALGVMTILSAAMGYTVPNIIPRSYTQTVATVLFLFFGFKLLKEAYDTDPLAENEELAEVEEELAEHDSEQESLDLEEGSKGKPSKPLSIMNRMFSKIFLQSFTMTFLAEWGDRSQIATIALAAAKDPVGVTIGGIIGHAICTGLAVLGGKMAATRISERAVKFIGGILFLVFALHAIIFGGLA
eukprot:gb/GEZN01009208.1/.p1 GENE.gb/GEZN01009208.1/~~gb/GEZN01009208.1/.p1  ORF type:complete len:358 (+),score=69.30 gb/GEZN01009208.1/:73-1074(+)